MKPIVQLFRPLLGAGVDVWRPVQAEHLYGDVYRILPQPVGLEDESWGFAPGAKVVCELIESSHGRILAAIQRAGQCWRERFCRGVIV